MPLGELDCRPTGRVAASEDVRKVAPCTYQLKDESLGLIVEPQLRSNLVTDGAEPTRLEITPAREMADVALVVHYSGFASNETVSLWYHRAGGRAGALRAAQASSDGSLDYPIVTGELSPGAYTLVASGQCSLVTAWGTFTAGAP